MVDAPRLVSSEASPTRPGVGGDPPVDAGGPGGRRESQPGSSAAKAARRARPAPGPAATRSVRRARATGSLTNRTSTASPAWFVLRRPDGDEDAVAAGRLGEVGPAQRGDLAAPHAGHEEQTRDHGVEPAAPVGEGGRLEAAPAAAGPAAGGEDGREVGGGERPRLPGRAHARRPTWYAKPTGYGDPAQGNLLAIVDTAFHGQAVKTVAYLCGFSTPQQDVRSQRLAILEHTRQHDFRVDDFIEATASGQASEKRRRLDELVAGSDRDHPRRPRQGRRGRRGAQGKHPGRGQARHPRRRS